MTFPSWYNKRKISFIKDNKIVLTFLYKQEIFTFRNLNENIRVNYIDHLSRELFLMEIKQI